MASIASTRGGPGDEGSERQPAPERQPARFGFGRAPAPEEIAALDIDVMPDGTGLPLGSGRADHGEAIYQEKCAWCHGFTGTEGPFDKLVGVEGREAFSFSDRPDLVKTIGNYWPYATTLFDYTYRAMPFDQPGSLTPDEVYALVAFLLRENQIISEDAVMSRETLPRVEMPARDRFVRDDRQGGPEVR